MWAASAPDIAAETAAMLPSLPPDERHSAAIRITFRNEVVSDFSNETNPTRPVRDCCRRYHRRFAKRGETVSRQLGPDIGLTQG